MIRWIITAIRTVKCMAELSTRVLALEKFQDGAVRAIDVLDKRDDDLRARQDEFAKV